MYRHTRKYAARRHWRPRPEIAAEDQRRPLWQPPVLRRRLTIEDFDGVDMRIHVVELFRTTRIDSYRAMIDGRPWLDRVGWSRVLDGLRKAMPRLASPRRCAE